MESIARKDEVPQQTDEEKPSLVHRHHDRSRRPPVGGRLGPQNCLVTRASPARLTCSAADMDAVT
jgi:hypothetical protein